MTSIHTLLVANRGEIALRVLRTAARLGMRTVAVHTDLDAGALHVRAADTAVRISSYLDVDAVVAAAVSSGADAVHPGYGFLSERAALATALEAADVVLVGPSAAVMEQMGRKDHARAVAIAAGVPVVPAGDDARALLREGPVLVKAAAGGGGKGMRVVRTEAELDEATAAARREALAAFGDDTMLVERYVEHGRHVEVQVLGDTHGTVLHFHERDCSTQRRHQKVLEEAPAPTLDEATAQRVRQAGVDLAAQVGYVGAGTVEFLLDADSGAFYFLEMNTRLQVEHPVTEATVRVRGEALDLVELQLRVAAGEPLGLTQDDVRLAGHAIEARVYAEDAFGGFLPQAGTAGIVRWPTGPGVRVDHALEPGQVVSTAYDPMLGKVVAHGPDRESARRALVRALDETVVLGLTTNAGFLRGLVASDAFRDAAVHTAWLDREAEETDVVRPPAPDVPRALAAWVVAMLGAGSPGDPFRADGFRLGAPPAATRVALDREVLVVRDPGGRSGTVDDVPFTLVSAAHHVVEGLLDGERVRAVVDAQPAGRTGAWRVEASWRGQRFVLTAPDRAAGAAGAGDGEVAAPMPGTVIDVRVAAGDVVEEGAVLGVLEAMKMELALRAPFAGTVGAVEVATGATVAIGAAMFHVEPDRAEGDQPT